MASKMARLLAQHHRPANLFVKHQKIVRMFRAVKKPLQVEVTMNGKTVRVKPLYKNNTEGLLYRTMARCEEFLAQMFLQEQQANYAGLKHFFQQRGWRVVEV